MRPLVWGILITVIAFIGWIAVSTYFGIATGLGGDPGEFFLALIWVFGLAWMFSLPLTIGFEIVQWFEKRQKRHRR